jgi:hypothetical protein
LTVVDEFWTVLLDEVATLLSRGEEMFRFE